MPPTSLHGRMVCVRADIHTNKHRTREVQDYKVPQGTVSTQHFRFGGKTRFCMDFSVSLFFYIFQVVKKNSLNFVLSLFSLIILLVNHYTFVAKIADNSLT